VAPTGAGPYIYTYTADETARTLKPYTMEYGDSNSTQDEWRATGVLANELEMGFDALTAPGNAMWTGSLGLMALNREANAMTAALSAPAALETMEGHRTTLAIGSTSTAFAALSAMTASLKSFRFTSTLNLVRLAYGGTSDIASDYGYSDKPSATFESLVKISATTKTAIHDVMAEATSQATEQRFRIAVDGDGNNAAALDYRTVFTAVNLGDNEGETLYLVQGKMVYDATLAGRYAFGLTNDVASVP
jgi:hypothetical protein